MYLQYLTWSLGIYQWLFFESIPLIYWAFWLYLRVLWLLYFMLLWLHLFCFHFGFTLWPFVEDNLLVLKLRVMTSVELYLNAILCLMPHILHWNQFWEELAGTGRLLVFMLLQSIWATARSAQFQNNFLGLLVWGIFPEKSIGWIWWNFLHHFVVFIQFFTVFQFIKAHTAVYYANNGL